MSILIRSGIANLVPLTRRSSGLHVSHIVHYLCIKRKIYDESELDDNGELSKRTMTRMQLGLAHEAGLKLRMSQDEPGRYSEIREIKKDNIAGSPDLIDWILLCVHEIKLTWMSSRNDMSSAKIWKYWIQLMAYVYMLDLSTKGRLHIGYVNGNYERYNQQDTLPQYDEWEENWTMQQLERNWQMLRANGDDAWKYNQERKERQTLKDLLAA